MASEVKLGKRKRSSSSFIDCRPSVSYSGNEPETKKSRDTMKSSEDDIIIVKEIIKKSSEDDIIIMKENIKKSSEDDIIIMKENIKKSSEDDDAIIVKEIIRNDAFENQLLYGSSYYCKVCEISINSKKVYSDHIYGKKHQKKVQSIMPDVVSEKLQKVQTRHTSPPAVSRRNSKDVALIQRAAECLKTPCPALNYITEIQSDRETYYRCDLCNTFNYLHEILNHLSDFEHMMKCVRHYDFATYKKIRWMYKWEAEEKLRKTLKSLVQRYGNGQITVERKVLDTEDSLTYNNRRGNIYNDSRWSTNYQDKAYGRSEKFIDQSNPYEYRRNCCTRRSSENNEADYKSSRHKFLSFPDVSKFDFYCQVCDAHMNSKNLWEQHITGARHMKNYKKELGQLPSKVKSVVIPNARAKLMDELEEITVPVVGLNSVQETYDSDLSVYKYRCFLCGLFSTSFEIIDHILSFKHRKKFLEAIKYPSANILKELKFSERSKEIIIADLCADVEDERGRGCIEVRTTDTNFKWYPKQYKSKYRKF